MKKYTNIAKAVVAASSTLALAFGLIGCAPQEQTASEPVPEPETVHATTLKVEAEKWDETTPAIAIFQGGVDLTPVYECVIDHERYEDGAAFDAHAASAHVDVDGVAYETIWLDDEGNEVKRPEPQVKLIENTEGSLIELEEDTYELTIVPPINADGSTYVSPETCEVEVKDIPKDTEEYKTYELTYVSIEEASVETLANTVAAATVAIEATDKTDEEKQALIDAFANAAAANPAMAEIDVAAMAEDVEAAVAAGVASIGDVASKPSANTPASTSVPAPSVVPAHNQSTPSASQSQGNNTGASSGGSTSQSKPSGSSGNSSANTGGGNSNPSTPAAQPSQPAHTHNWVPVTEAKTVIDVPAQGRVVCNQCNTVFSTVGEWGQHCTRGGSCVSYHTDDIPAQTHTETVVTGYTCSCGATK